MLRPATQKDCRSIWLWRNHPQARRWSFHPEKISYQNHCQWFKAKINSPLTKIYIGCNKRGQRIGQVRFDQREAKVIVSITLNPRYYGRGLGSHLIKAATSRYLTEHIN